MEGVESKSHSLQQDSQITPGNSAWLAENVEGFQQRVKEILKMVERDGNLSETTPETYDHKSELTTQVAELSRMYKALADQHGHLIGEFSRNCISPIKSQHLDSCDSSSSSPQVTQMFTPDQTINTNKYRTPIGFDSILSSGGNGYHVSGREGSESSFSLSSDTDSESFMSLNKLLISPVNDHALKVKETNIITTLHEKIANLEEELQNLADENTNLKGKIHENESATELISDLQSLLDQAQNDITTQNANLEAEKAKVVNLQKQVDDLKLVISESDGKILTAEDEILKMKLELGSNQQQIELLQMQLDSEKDKVLGLQEEVSLCIADVTVRDDQITELKTTHEVKQDGWNAGITRLERELSEKCQSVNDLNKDMDVFKQKYDALMTERDGVNAQLDTLRAEMCSRNNLVQELETRLESLHVEHERVLSSFDHAQKVTNELRLRVVELEREVDRQMEVLSDRAEEKREAIRQLSFSLEHYMSGYKELRQAFIGHRRHAILTS